ncbi:hypothetical protein HDU82_004440 [Entophlyctis luteolus]|nr:hypothetical protein HDU82_004440 [Entophlyctis luteolus]
MPREAPIPGTPLEESRHPNTAHSLGQVGSNAEQAFTLLDSIQSGAPIPSANFRDHPVMSAPESFEGPDVVSMDRFSRPLTSSVLRRAALQLNDHHTSLSHFAFAPPNGDDDDECREDDYRGGAAVTVASAGTMRLRQRYPRSYARMSRALGLQQQAPAANEQATLAGADWRQGDAGMDSNTASEEASVVNRLVDQVLIELGVGASGDGTVLPLPPPLPPPPPPPLRRDRQQQQHLRPRFTTVFQQRNLVAGDRPAVPAIPAFHAFAPHAGLFRDAVAMRSPLTSDRLDAVRRATAAILGCEDDSLWTDATTTCLTFIRASPSLSEHYQVSDVSFSQFVDQTVISPAEIIGNNRLQQASQPARQLSGSGVNFQKTGELPYLEWLRSRSLVDSNGNSISNLNESVPSLLSANDCGGLVDGKETEACGFDIPEGGMEILMRLVFDADGNHRAMTPEDVVCVFEEWDSMLGCSVTAKVTSDVEIEVVPHLHDDKVSQKPAVRDVWRGQRSRLTSAYPATLSTHSQASAGTRTSKDVVPTKVLLAPAETHFRAVSESRIFASNIVKFKRALLAQQPKPTDPDTPNRGTDCATEQAPPTATFAQQNFECEQPADKTRNDQTAAALPPAGSAAQSRAIVDIDTADGGAGSVRPEVAGPACSRGTVAADARSTRSSYYRRKLPESCTSFDSDAGRLTFAQAVAGEHMEIFFVLAMQFATQSEPAYCGLGTLVMVLNSLQVDPLRQWKGVWREVSFQRSLFFPGFTDLSHAGGTTKTFCKYNATSQEVLIFDVARFKYPAYWVSVELLWESMLPIDESTGKPRGYCILSKAKRGLVHSATSKISEMSSQSWPITARKMAREIRSSAALSILESFRDDSEALRYSVVSVSDLQTRKYQSDGLPCKSNNLRKYKSLFHLSYFSPLEELTNLLVNKIPKELFGLNDTILFDPTDEQGTPLIEIDDIRLHLSQTKLFGFVNAAVRRRLRKLDFFTPTCNSQSALNGPKSLGLMCHEQLRLPHTRSSSEQFSKHQVPCLKKGPLTSRDNYINRKALKSGARRVSSVQIHGEEKYQLENPTLLLCECNEYAHLACFTATRLHVHEYSDLSGFLTLGIAALLEMQIGDGAIGGWSDLWTAGGCAGQSVDCSGHDGISREVRFMRDMFEAVEKL